jgi:hypothetical protein
VNREDDSLPSLSPDALLPPITIPDEFMRDMWDSAKAQIHAMASQGWTLQMRFTLAVLDDLAKLAPEQIDEFFVTFYTEDDFAELRAVREKLARRQSLAQWRELLEECFDSFTEGRHLITIPALLSIIDGVIASAGAVVTSRRAELLAACTKNAEKLGAGSLRGELWTSLREFMEKLFETAPFDGTRPALINRHWILHGRDTAAASWTVADALRLFNALQTIAPLLA